LHRRREIRGPSWQVGPGRFAVAERGEQSGFSDAIRGQPGLPPVLLAERRLLPPPGQPLRRSRRRLHCRRREVPFRQGERACEGLTGEGH
jgi:hypothetical protein